MSNLLEKFETLRLSRDAMKSIKGGDGVGWHFSGSTSGSGGTQTYIWNTDEGIGALADFLSGGGEDGNPYSTSGWCCQNDDGYAWIYRTNDALQNAVGTAGGPTVGPAGGVIHCTTGTYCP